MTRRNRVSFGFEQTDARTKNSQKRQVSLLIEDDWDHRRQRRFQIPRCTSEYAPIEERDVRTGLSTIFVATEKARFEVAFEELIDVTAVNMNAAGTTRET